MSRSIDNKQRHYRHWGLIESLSPMTHNKGTEGNEGIINTIPIPYNGYHIDVPILSGNALRHKIFREPGMMYMVDICGLEGQLSREQLNLLFSGGALTKSTANYDMNIHRQLRKKIPLLSVLGGALPGQIEHGCLKVWMSYLVCKETIGLIKKMIKDDELFEGLDEVPSFSEMKTHTQYTRPEPTKNPKLVALLDSKEQEHLLETTQKTKKIDKVETQQMIYGGEAISPGSLWLFGFDLCGATEIEYGATLASIALFQQNPYLGGQSRIGHGFVNLKLANGGERRLEEIKTIPMEGSLSERYRQFLDENKQDIVNLLGSIYE